MYELRKVDVREIRGDATSYPSGSTQPGARPQADQLGDANAPTADEHTKTVLTQHNPTGSETC